VRSCLPCDRDRPTHTRWHRAPTPQIQTYTTPEGVDAFAKDGGAATKAGATLTYGPFSDVPASTDAGFSGAQQAISVQYAFDQPVLEIQRLERAAEVSHWGANMNIQDAISLRNAGPALKGHFSRLEHQTQKFYQRTAPHVLPELALRLPPGIRDAYYTDTIGNVSTSKLRVGQYGLPGAHSVLEMRPRYPLLGGWNYSFVLGWDAPLAHAGGFDAQSGKYAIGVPVMTLLPGALVSDATVTIILPEGATLVLMLPSASSEG
jgi:oligosaccharyltransferase complex subunit alpha (ribophorin I)